MNARLNLGVQKWLDGDSLDARSSPFPTGVFAEVVSLTSAGKPIQTLVPIGAKQATKAIEVPSGRLNVQVRLPSGEILTEDMELGEAEERTVLLESRQSPREWMSWPGLVSPMAAQRLDTQLADARVSQLQPHLWVREAHGQLTVSPERRWQAEIDSPLGLLSCTFTGGSPDGVEGFGKRHYLAYDVPGPQQVLATVPVPWNTDGPQPRVQVVLKLCHGEGVPSAADVDVLVQDEWLAPMLGYLHSGDLAAARQFAPSVRDAAETFLFEKMRSPLAAAAGGYLLLQTRSLEQLHDWPANLAERFEWLPDGAIIRATQLLRDRSRKRDLDEIRQLLLAAGRRGAPVFTEGVRLLGDGLRLLGSWEGPGSRQRRALDPGPFESLIEWVEVLESATRPDALFTILQADDGQLRSLVEGLRA